MIPKSGHRFSDEIMRQAKSMIPKSAHRFSDEIMRRAKNMLEQKNRSTLRKAR